LNFFLVKRLAGQKSFGSSHLREDCAGPNIGGHLTFQMHLTASYAGQKKSGKQPGGKMQGMASQVSLDTQNNVTEELISERRLWTAVLVNAVEDWRGGNLRARREAQEFLFESEVDFEMVCAGAGLDAGDFRARLLKFSRRIGMDGPLMLLRAA
jgi:hypothetical protein